MALYVAFFDPADERAEAALRPVVATLRHSGYQIPARLESAREQPPNPLLIGWFRNLRLLRGYAAHIEVTGNPPENPDRCEDAYKTFLDPFYREKRSCKRFKHLIMHADDEGFYLPVAFDEPLWKVSQSPWLPKLRWTERSVGSAVALRQELEDLNGYLQLPPEFDATDETRLWEHANTLPFNVESGVWHVLHWSACKSVSTGLVIEFV